MNDTLIHTPQLTLVPATLPLLLAERDDPAAWRAALAAEVTAEWPPGEYDHGALEFFVAQLEQQPPEMAVWYLWYAVRPAPRPTLVAAAGFYGPPQEGCVEIGYSVVPVARNQGVAREVVDALVAFAFAHGVREVIAHTTDANTASTRVLTRCGFAREEGAGDGDSVRYRRTPARSQ